MLSFQAYGIGDEGYDETIVEGDNANIFCPEKYFDAVVDVCSICMDHRFPDIFNEVARVLKRGGRLISVVPKYDCYDDFEEHDSVQFFTMEHIRKCLNGKFHPVIKLVEHELEPTKIMRFWLVDALRMS